MSYRFVNPAFLGNEAPPVNLDTSALSIRRMSWPLG
jgi:hypothetical protein